MSRALRRLARPDQAPEAAPAPTFERCEMCTARIDEHEHSHVVHLEKRALLCTCRPCAMLFTERGAARGRYRAVPDRYLRDPEFTMTELEWDSLQIPVRMAFFFRNSDLDKPLAFYPGPAGATESLLPMDAWRDGLGGSALARELEFDVEALLLRKVENDTGSHTECLLVPIDVCYELVGLVRTHWKGFEGGSEAWDRIDAFFADLADRTRDLAREG